MLRARSRLLLPLLVAASLLAGFAGFAPAAADPGAPAGEIALPALYGNTVPRVSFFGASPHGVAWLLQEGDDRIGTAYYTSYTGAKHTSAGFGDTDNLSLSGNELIGGPDGHLTALNIDTGTRQTARCSPDYIDPSTGDQWCMTGPGLSLGTSVRLSNATAGTSTVYQLPALPPGYTSLVGGYVDRFDGNGAVLVEDGSPPGGGNTEGYLLYLDFASGTATVLDGTDYSESDQFAMDDAAVAWGHGTSIHWLDRTPGTSSGVGTAGVITTAERLGEVALSGGNIAYSTTAGSGGGGEPYAIHSGVLGAAPATFGNLPSQTLGVFTGQAGNFLVFKGKTVATYGGYRLTSGADTLGGAVVLFGPGAPLGIDASAGRIVSVLPDGANSPAQQQRVATDSSDATAQASAASRLVDHSLDSAPPATSGGNTAYLTMPTKDSCAVVILNGTNVVSSYPVPETCYHVTLSGGLALVSYTGQYIDDTHSLPPGGVLIDLDTGARTIVPETEALSGDSLAYFAGGGVDVENLTTGAVRTVATSVVPTGSSQDPAQDFQLAIAGNWVLWSVIGSSADGLQAYDLATNTAVDLPAAATMAPDLMDGAVDAALADGVVVWIDKTTRSVHLDALADSGATDSIVGTAHQYADNHQYLALTDEFAAWVADDDTTRVLPLSGASTVAPAYLGGINKPAFSPALTGARADFRPQLDVTRPLTSWSMTISRHGHVVRTLQGSAPIGGVRPSWNGRTSSGSKAPNGTYTWTLSGRGSTGSLRAENGTSHAITGRIRLDTLAPHAHVSHRRIRHRGGKVEVPLRWSCSGGPCRFDITVEVRSTSTGDWSAAKRWLAATAKHSAVYGSGHVPRRLQAGRSYRFLVRAVDLAGNHSQVRSTTILIPRR